MIANNKAWASAETVRREWLATFVARKTAPKGAEALICEAVVTGHHSLSKAMDHRHPMLFTLLGVDRPTGYYGAGHDGCYKTATKASTPKAATMTTLAAVVAAWEATEVPADLAAIAEGRPPRGLGELLAARDMVQSAGTLAGYTAPQTSHAAVIGSVSNREELSPADVWAVRALLGTYYQVEIADTGNNLQRPATETLLEGADAIVIPCVVNHKSARGLERALRAAERIPSLRGRAILVVSHDGGPEDAEFAQTLTAQLAHHFRTKAIVEIPFDPAIRADGELTYSALQPATRLAIRRVARHVIECFNNAPFNESE